MTTFTYQSTPTVRERSVTLSLVVILHVAFGLILLNLSDAPSEIAKQADLKLIEIVLPQPADAPEPPPPPPEPSERRQDRRQNAPNEQGASSPANIASKASPVVTPPTIVPVKTEVAAATLPSTGSAATSGASDDRGPGTGAGGLGTGTGSGDGGSGSGGGGSGLGEARARLLTPMLSRRDFPPRLYYQAPRGGSVFMVLRVGSDGVPLSCRVARSFGDAQIDSETCRLAVERLRFSPGRDEQGRPVADFFGYRQQFNTRF